MFLAARALSLATELKVTKFSVEPAYVSLSRLAHSSERVHRE